MRKVTVAATQMACCADAGINIATVSYTHLGKIRCGSREISDHTCDRGSSVHLSVAQPDSNREDSRLLMARYRYHRAGNQDKRLQTAASGLESLVVNEFTKFIF